MECPWIYPTPLRFPGCFEAPLFRPFFHFPWDFEIAGFDCTCVCTGVLKNILKCGCMDAIKLLLTPPGTQTKFTDTRVTPALKSEKYFTLILMRKHISLSPFWIFSTKKHWRNTRSRNERNKRAWYSESNVKCVISLNLKFSNLVDASSRHSRQNRCPHLVCKGSRRGKLQIQHWKSSSTTLTKFSW